ncbi:MAG TPA: tetratricopeptide repeat protein, partial [Candidatus Polarisedimenticolia bacterium]|nr:tetratricopeptide repeat protein [Candidatus Polarisedimenticolia bacterium]
LRSRDPDSAARSASRALDYADTARGHLLLARALLASGKEDQARAELEKTRLLDPSDPEIEDLRRSLDQGQSPSGRTP